MIKVKRPEGIFFLPTGLPKHYIQRFKKDGSEPWLRQHMCELLAQRPGSVISAGTYVGGLLPTVSRCASTVYAWEPVQQHYACTKQMLRKNRIQNVILHHAALGNSRNNLDITTGATDGAWLGGASSIIEQDVPVSPLLTTGAWSWRTEQVVQNRIDDFVYENLSILQLDLEGYELPALQGAESTIAQHRPWIIVENPNQELDSAITGWGYTLEQHCAGDSVYKYTKGADHVKKTTK